MATTCKDLIDAAYARSTFNDPDKLATDAELIGVIDRRHKQLYSMAAEYNPVYFGKSENVQASSSAWTWPDQAELIFRVEVGTTANNQTSGTLVRVVPIEDQEADIKPSVYQMGRSYYTTDSTELDPTASTGDDLLFYYSKRAYDLDDTIAPDANTGNTVTSETDQGNIIDSTWPEQFNDLIVLHIAKYLSIKDGRAGEEIAALDAEEKALMADFARHLRHANYAQRARYGQRARLVNPGIGADA